jgi:four helix bundle protein
MAEIDREPQRLSGLIRRHTDLDVYRTAFDVAMEIFQRSKSFPVEEKYALTDQIRRSSRSVCANIAEAWRKRKYRAAFISKLSDSEAEAAETETWIQFAVQCGYMEREAARAIYDRYEKILGSLVRMANNADTWATR